MQCLSSSWGWSLKRFKAIWLKMSAARAWKWQAVCDVTKGLTHTVVLYFCLIHSHCRCLLVSQFILTVRKSYRPSDCRYVSFWHLSSVITLWLTLTGFGCNLNSLKEKMSLIQPCIFVDVSRSNLTAKAEAAMLELKRDGGMVCFTLVLFFWERATALANHWRCM